LFEKLRRAIRSTFKENNQAGCVVLVLCGLVALCLFLWFAVLPRFVGL